MKVAQLARLVGLRIEDVVAVVLGDTRGPGALHRLRPIVDTDTTRLGPPSSEPPLAAMLGHATYHDVHRAVDRWLIARVLDEERGNISHAAHRLRVSRRTLRQRWARVRELPPRHAAPPPATALPGGTREHAPPSLTELLDQGRTYAEIRDAVDRWLIGNTLARAEGNVTHAARHLGIVRKQVRERWARVRPQ
jgi:DNA-binding NtrC family response regulator